MGKATLVIAAAMLVLGSSAAPASEARRAKAAAGKATTRGEELPSERRAELDLRRAAQQMRGRPPSI